MSSEKRPVGSMHESWAPWLSAEFKLDYMVSLRSFLLAEKQLGKQIYPSSANWFNAFTKTPFDSVRVVILGQDPYHGPGQAHGLCFSVPVGVATPPSLKNIFAEINRDMGIETPRHGCLEHWAGQGVLLLNSVLTVEQFKAASHQGRGWERFTDKVIQVLSNEKQGLVFMLWGSYAQKKGQVIDSQRHLVLRSPHPSPLSAHRGFLGNGHFSAANEYLQKNGSQAIDWSLP